MKPPLVWLAALLILMPGTAPGQYDGGGGGSFSPGPGFSSGPTIGPGQTTYPGQITNQGQSFDLNDIIRNGDSASDFAGGMQFNGAYSPDSRYEFDLDQFDAGDIGISFDYLKNYGLPVIDPRPELGGLYDPTPPGIPGIGSGGPPPPFTGPDLCLFCQPSDPVGGIGFIVQQPEITVTNRESLNRLNSDLKTEPPGSPAAERLVACSASLTDLTEYDFNFSGMARITEPGFNRICLGIEEGGATLFDPQQARLCLSMYEAYNSSCLSSAASVVDQSLVHRTGLIVSNAGKSAPKILCTGFLIDPNTVITARHCLKRSSFDDGDFDEGNSLAFYPHPLLDHATTRVLIDGEISPSGEIVRLQLIDTEPDVSEDVLALRLAQEISLPDPTYVSISGAEAGAGLSVLGFQEFYKREAALRALLDDGVHLDDSVLLDSIRWTALIGVDAGPACMAVSADDTSIYHYCQTNRGTSGAPIFAGRLTENAQMRSLWAVQSRGSEAAIGNEEYGPSNQGAVIPASLARLIEPSNPQRDASLCSDIITNSVLPGADEQALLGLSALWELNSRCAAAIAGYFSTVDGNNKALWSTFTSTPMLLALARIAPENPEASQVLNELAKPISIDPGSENGLFLPVAQPEPLSTPQECTDHPDADPFSHIDWDQVLDMIRNGSGTQYVTFFGGDADLVLQNDCVNFPLAQSATPDRLRALALGIRRPPAADQVVGELLGYLGRSNPQFRPVVVDLIEQVLIKATQTEDFIRDQDLSLANHAIRGLGEYRALATRSLAQQLPGLRPVTEFDKGIWDTCDLLSSLGPYSDDPGFLDAATAHLEALKNVRGLHDYLYQRCLAHFVHALTESNYQGEIGLLLIHEIVLDAEFTGEPAITGYDDLPYALLQHLVHHGGLRAISLLERYLDLGETDAVRAFAEMGRGAAPALPAITAALRDAADRDFDTLTARLTATTLIVGRWRSLGALAEQFGLNNQAQWTASLAALDTVPREVTLGFANDLERATGSGPANWKLYFTQLLGGLGPPALDILTLLEKSDQDELRIAAYQNIARLLLEDDERKHIQSAILEQEPGIRDLCDETRIQSEDEFWKFNFTLAALTRIICQPQMARGG